MRPPVRPPQLRCVFFSSMYLPHLLVLPATFWTSVPFATLSVFPSLICGSCPSGQRFAYSFFQIPSHGGHPCCSAMCFVVAYAHLGLSPIRKRPCWANKKRTNKKMFMRSVFVPERFGFVGAACAVSPESIIRLYKFINKSIYISSALCYFHSITLNIFSRQVKCV